MKNKIILFNTILLSISLIAFFVMGIFVTKQNHISEAEEKVVEVADIYCNNYVSPEQSVVGDNEKIRVTIISSDGTVMADSFNVDVSSLGNHLTREEIVSAMEGKSKTYVRYSDTLNKNMVYYALKKDIGDSYVFIRVAVAVEDVNEYIINSIPYMAFVLIIAMVLTIFASVFASNALLKPLSLVGENLSKLSSGEFKSIVPATNDDDINKMLVNINEISEKLQKTVLSLKVEKEKLDYVLNNVSEGIILLDSERNIVLINDSATKIFSAENCVGKNSIVLTSDILFHSKIEECIKGKKSIAFDYETESEKIYRVAVERLEGEMLIIALADITEVKLGEKTRSEFFANASHELKTPLTAVKGFNDLITLNTSDEKIKELSQRIDKETQRIISLINDMLNLSKLENSNEKHCEKISLLSIAQEVSAELTVEKAKKNVDIEIVGDGEVLAEREHIYELIKNLTENSIRYSGESVKVSIKITQDKKETCVVVEDNGIGISEKDLPRIFERFYRVNKSRSRESGGTGLGLAIVKHVCELYGAKINVESKIGVGTKFKIAFLH